MNDTTENKALETTPNEEEKISRRRFLAVAGAATAAIAAAPLLNQPLLRQAHAFGGSEGKHKWGMVIDITKCIGCNYCTYACQAVNNLAPGMEYNVVTVEKTANGDDFFLSRPCLHCDHAPCVQVCPVKATYMRDDGIVAMDYDLCIGCRYCQVACPYGARVFNWTENDPQDNPRVPDFGYPEVEARPRGVVEKCTFCQHRIDPALERGLVPGVDESATPACVVVCPTGARIFGDLNDAESSARKALRETPVPITLRPELSTDPKVFYIPPHEAVGGNEEES